MKRILIFIMIIMITTCSVIAKDKYVNLQSIKFDGAKYNLYYSTKVPEVGGYINEYFKKNQTYTVWTEMIALQHYPNAYSPIDQAKDFSKYLASSGIPSTLTEYNDNTAIMDFVVINSKKRPIIVEFNIFKFVKSPVCGSYGLQYAKRYRLSNGIEVEKAKKSITKMKKKYIKKVNKIKIPELVTVNVDKGKIVSHEGVDDSYYSDFK